MADDQISISQLLAPLSINDFFENYWEQNYIHVQKENHSYEDLITIDQLDDFLSLQNLKPEGLRLAKNGEQIPEKEWTKTYTILDGVKNITVAPELVLRHYNDGATIIISFADMMIPALGRINKCIEHELGIKSQANVYITPPNAQGFSKHYDTHDIFLLQIKGPKTWRMYHSGEELPTSVNSFKKEPKLLEEINIETGDLLYMPRGVVHEAFSSDVATIHVNFSIKPRYGFHLIEELAKLAEENDTFFRKTIPNRYTSTNKREEYIKLFNEHLTNLINQFPTESLLQTQQNLFIEKQALDLKGRLSNIIEAERLTLTTQVARYSGVEYQVTKDENGIVINFGNQKISIPKLIDPNVFLQDEPFLIKEIKGLVTESQKLSLAKTLIQSGYIKIHLL